MKNTLKSSPFFLQKKKTNHLKDLLVLGSDKKLLLIYSIIPSSNDRVKNKN